MRIYLCWLASHQPFHIYFFFVIWLTENFLGYVFTILACTNLHLHGHTNDEQLCQKIKIIERLRHDIIPN